ncbi:MAG: hypothetical protein JO069_05175 [Verrucomicrobia bacterium]|nr:hypothetical protein [Verrucomicrobiota bacterium]
MGDLPQSDAERLRESGERPEAGFPDGLETENPNVDGPKIRSTVKPSPDNEVDPSGQLSDRPTFHVIIIYEDRTAARRAKCFFDNFVHELENQCDFDLELWNFQVLAISEIANSAARVAAQADFIIVSLRGRTGLPVETRAWIETWSQLISNRDAALIALTDKSPTRVVASTLAYLRGVAYRAGLDFFAHTVFYPSAT